MKHMNNYSHNSTNKVKIKKIKFNKANLVYTVSISALPPSARPHKEVER